MAASGEHETDYDHAEGAHGEHHHDPRAPAAQPGRREKKGPGSRFNLNSSWSRAAR